MKIYYIANARMPSERAYGIQLAKMCEAFLEEEVDLKLVLPNRRTALKTIQEFYNLRKAVPVKKLPIIDLYNRGRWSFRLSSCVFMLVYFLYFLFQKIKGVKGILYTIDMDNFSFLLVPMLGWPYFVELHDAKKKNFIYSFLFKRARGIIVINSLIKEKLMNEFHLSAEKIIVYPNGIDLNSFSSLVSKSEARQKLNLPLDPKISVYTGRFYNWKGLGIFFDAAKKLTDEALFFLVGGSETELKKITQKNNLPLNLVCVGYKDYREIPLWLAAADVLIVLGTKKSEYSYYYTSPMKLFEYLAIGRPIIASRTPAIQSVVSPEEVFFYEPDNSDDLVSQIKNIFNHKEVAEDKIKKLLQKAKNFTWSKRAREILQFIKLNANF